MLARARKAPAHCEIQWKNQQPDGLQMAGFPAAPCLDGSAENARPYRPHARHRTHTLPR